MQVSVSFDFQTCIQVVLCFVTAEKFAWQVEHKFKTFTNLNDKSLFNFQLVAVV